MKQSWLLDIDCECDSTSSIEAVPLWRDLGIGYLSEKYKGHKNRNKSLYESRVAKNICEDSHRTLATPLKLTFPDHPFAFANHIFDNSVRDSFSL